MAHNTFISYKYPEGKYLRNRIIKALGEDGRYYRGETSSSPDLSDRTTEYIRENLKDLIYHTSVTIVIISPKMKESNWIDWEIEYALKEIKRGDRKSSTNGVLGVVMKYNNDYSWLRSAVSKNDGHSVTSTDTTYLYDIIKNNRANQTPPKYVCEKCQSIDALEGSYISLIDEETFFENPNKYIDNAYNKSKNIDNYDLRRTK